MEEHDIKALLEKYKNGSLSAAEKAILESWYNQQAIDSQFSMPDEVIEQNLAIIASRLPLKRTGNSKKLWIRVAAAASVVIVMASALVYNQLWQSGQNVNVVKQDFEPGGNKAYLTLSNGKKISLSDTYEGAIADQSGIIITKTREGKLIYTSGDSKNPGLQAGAYNSIETPKGGQYRIQLPDGTEVWLNSQSSLRYPTSFAGMNERSVELSGEGYFQVAKDSAHPFRVKCGGQTVKVLGTHFNINNYPNESAAKTTLLEGSVLLNDKITLRPGEQATMPVSGQIGISRVDLDEAVAWKNGKFIFADEDIQSIMRKLQRWYNFEVSYDGPLPKQTFTASISRFDQISKILDKLSYTNNVHFKIEGRRITVMR